MSEDRDFDQHHHSHHHKKENKGWIAIAVAVFIVAMLVIVGLFGLKNAKSILAQANEMKSNLSTAIACIKEKDPDGAESAIEKADSVYKEMEKTLNVKFCPILYVPKAGNYHGIVMIRSEGENRKIRAVE